MLGVWVNEQIDLELVPCSCVLEVFFLFVLFLMEKIESFDSAFFSVWNVRKNEVTENKNEPRWTLML